MARTVCSLLALALLGPVVGIEEFGLMYPVSPVAWRRTAARSEAVVTVAGSAARSSAMSSAAVSAAQIAAYRLASALWRRVRASWKASSEAAR